MIAVWERDMRVRESGGEETHRQRGREAEGQKEI